MELGWYVYDILHVWTHTVLNECGNVGNPPPKQTAAQQVNFKMLRVWVRPLVHDLSLQYHICSWQQYEMLKCQCTSDSAFYLCSSKELVAVWSGTDCCSLGGGSGTPLHCTVASDLSSGRHDLLSLEQPCFFKET